VPTGLSSTSAAAPPALRSSRAAAARRAVADVGHLVRFRAGTVRRPKALRWTIVVMVAITAAVIAIPMSMEGAASSSSRSRDVLLLLPTGFAAFLLLTIVSGIASGGGRELLSREQGVAFPVSPTTDHLGALLLAPLNIAWLLQGWVLIGSAAYGLPKHLVAPAVIAILLWLIASTAMAQVVAWSMEAVRRRPGGVPIIRVGTVAVGLAAVVLQVSGRLGPMLDAIPTVWLVSRSTVGFTMSWVAAVAVELVVIAGAIALGAVPAHLAARRAPRDEARVESGLFGARRLPATTIGMLIRLDRSSVWRAVPMRRGIIVLAVGPGLVAIAGDLPWPSMTILPGLVASGGALLFGVNAWCLDGRGLLWRESLPARPGEVFAARAYVLAEFLMVASLLTILLGALRAGLPSSYELSALVCLVLVVTVQVVAAALRWSARRPFPVDMRSARATPAPPIVMVSYSSRLALSTTMTGLVFSGLSRVPMWELSVLVAVPFLAWSSWRLVRAQRRWLDPVQRAAVVMTVAA
jgi:hypothetical protein